MFTSWLLIHRDTLKSVDIGYLRCDNNFEVFDATRFPRLEYLRLSRHAMPRDLIFRSNDTNILGPRVKTFGWDFSIYDQHSESWTAFGEREELWVSELVKAVVAQRAALKEIVITFTPDSWDIKREWGYPWDRMIRVRDGIATPNGITLRWNEPKLSREGWLEELKRQEDFRENLRNGIQPEQHEEHVDDYTSTVAIEEPALSTESSEEGDFQAFEPFQANRDIRDYFPCAGKP